MRVTVCELPHEPAALCSAWDALCDHTTRQSSDLVLLPEFAFVEPVWERKYFDRRRWECAEALCEGWLARLHELGAARVVGTRPVTIDGHCFNQGFVASPADGVVPLRRKYFIPNEPGGWESRWYKPGDSGFGAYAAGALRFGLNICTELWALESYALYALGGVEAVLTPRATSAATTRKWLAAGVVAAVRSGAFSLSSNRVDESGACGGTGWIISPDGDVLATTTREVPFATVDIDLEMSVDARASYPRYIFSQERATRSLSR
jgi:N-carbamoylputrescine amidase